MQLKTPTPEQFAAYGECLRFDAKRSAERGAGRSGYLGADDTAAHATASLIVDAALIDGVGFDIHAYIGRAAAA